MAKTIITSKANHVQKTMHFKKGDIVSNDKGELCFVVDLEENIPGMYKVIVLESLNPNNIFELQNEWASRLTPWRGKIIIESI